MAKFAYNNTKNTTRFLNLTADINPTFCSKKYQPLV